MLISVRLIVRAVRRLLVLTKESAVLFYFAAANCERAYKNMALSNVSAKTRTTTCQTQKASAEKNELDIGIHNPAVGVGRSGEFLSSSGVLVHKGWRAVARVVHQFYKFP